MARFASTLVLLLLTSWLPAAAQQSSFDELLDDVKVLELPLTVGEGDIVDLPGRWLDDSVVRRTLGADPALGHYYAKGLLRRSDTLVALLVKFEALASFHRGYRDLYRLVTVRPDGELVDAIDIAHFEGVAGSALVSSEAVIEPDLSVRTLEMSWEEESAPSSGCCPDDLPSEARRYRLTPSGRFLEEK